MNEDNLPMRLREIEDWAGEGSLKRRAEAIATLGVLVGNDFQGDIATRLRDPDNIASILRRLHAQAGDAQRVKLRRLRWGAGDFLSPRWNEVTKHLDPDVAAEAWRSFTQFDGDIYLQCPTRDFNTDDIVETFALLPRLFSARGAKIRSIYFEWWPAPDRLPTPSTGDWHWPLRIGFLPDERSLQLMHAFVQERGRAPLTKIIDVARTGQRCDILLSPWDAARTSELLTNTRVRASALLLIGQQPPISESDLSLFRKLRALTHVSAISLIPNPATGETIVEIVRAFSPDRLFDQAVSIISRSTADVPRWPLTIAEPDFINRSRIDDLDGDEARHLQPRENPESFGIRPRRSVSSRTFNQVSDPVGDLVRLDSARLEVVETRKLKANAWEVATPKHKRPDIHDHRAKTGLPNWYFIRIHIAPATKDDAPGLVFPEHKIDWSSGPQRLQISVVAPGCDLIGFTGDLTFSSAQVDSYIEEALLRSGEVLFESDLVDISIASKGSSTDALFLLNAPEVASMRLRVLVSHENRILQTAILDLNKDHSREQSDAEAVEIKIGLTQEGILRPTFEDLSNRRPFDLAILTNDSLTGAAQFTAISGGKVVLGNLDEVKGAAEKIRVRLNNLINAPNDFKEADSDALTSLLRGLAQEGVALRRYFVDQNLGSIIESDPGRLQIVSAKPDEALPVEFIYDGPAPDADTATICPNQTQSLVSGSCGDCPHRKTRSHVCAMRFWGLRKIIERHVFRPGHGETSVSATEPSGRNRIGRPTNRLFGSSDRAQKFKGGADAIKSLMQRLQPLAVIPAVKVLSANKWAAWRSHVSDNSPTLLVLVPHTDLHNDNEVLEIGDGDLLTNAEIDTDVVGGSQPTIVLLLGCETAKPELRFASFVASFRHAKAAVVIGTLTPVLGRHAAPVAAALIEQLDAYWDQSRPTTIGDAIVEVRRQFMAQGLPVALTLVAFGDADWLLGGADVQT